MTTINVSNETRVRLTNRKTYELSSVNKVLVDMLDRDQGVQPTSADATDPDSKDEQWEKMTEAEQSRIPLECRPKQEA